MGLNAVELGEIDALLGAPEAGNEALAELRRRFPGLSLTRCDASDIDAEEPFRAYRRFTLYLVDGTDHCWHITGDPVRATGLVIVPNKVKT
jgi:hypothetical protein